MYEDNRENPSAEPCREPFDVEVREYQGYVLVRVHGVVSNVATLEFTHQLEETVADEEIKGIILVCNHLESMASKAFGAVVSAFIILRYRKRGMAVVQPPANFRNLMAITGLDTVVPICATIDKAIRKLR